MLKFIYKKIAYSFIALIVILTIFFALNNTSSFNGLISSLVNISETNDSVKLSILIIEGFDDQYTFNSDTKTYNISIFEKTYYLNIRAIPESDSAEVSISGNDILEGNNGTITLTVTNGNNSDNYLINWEKNATISPLTREFSYTGRYQTFTSKISASYKIELWGGSGYYSYIDGAPGAYTSGILNLRAGEEIYFYIGSAGWQTLWNGGACNGYCGGNPSDVRLIKTSSETVWNEADSLKSRIMVAAAGGAGVQWGDGNNGISGYNKLSIDDIGYGGALVGGNGSYDPRDPDHKKSTGGTQTSGGIKAPEVSGWFNNNGNNGSFGIGGQADSAGGWVGGGAGGGYYGGGGGASGYARGGAGGSSFISGYLGCVAVQDTEEIKPRLDSNGNVCTDSSALSDIECSKHYSGKVFNEPVMIAGNETVPAWSTIQAYVTSGGKGNNNEGHGKITLIDSISNYNFLDSIYISNGTLDKDFNKTTYDYTLTIDPFIHVLTFSKNRGASDVTVDGLGEYELDTLNPAPITLTVIGEDGSTRLYTFNVIRGLSNLKNPTSLYGIKNLTNDETVYFEEDVYNYSGLTAYTNQITLDIELLKFNDDTTCTIQGNEGVVNNGYIIIECNDENSNSSAYKVSYTLVESDFNELYEYTGNYQLINVPYSGSYKIELWGASSGTNLSKCTWSGCYGATNYIGYGAYTSGDISLNKNNQLYIYIGQVGYTSFNTNKYAFNGGGSFPNGYSDGNNVGGGGATDIRIIKATDNTWYDTSHSSWNSDSSLLSRIMVAGGGGGVVLPVTTPGYAGGLKASATYGPSEVTSLSNQTSGPQIGLGQAGNRASAGGGYYGGYATTYAGSGGTSFISGHTGCVAFKSSSSNSAIDGCATGTTDNSCSIHYSGYRFINTKMIDGAGYAWTNDKGSREAMPNPNGGYFDSGIGNSGDGYARVTALSYNISDNFLNSLTSSNGTLDKEFLPSITEYTLTVDKYEKTINITGTVSDDENIQVVGLGDYNLTARPEPITITVTAVDGSTRTYTINIERNLGAKHTSEIFTIKNVTNNQTFECVQNKYNYDGLKVYTDQVKIDLDIDLFDKDATYVIRGNEGILEDGTITVTVSAPGVSNATYTLPFTRTEYVFETRTYDMTGDYQLLTIERTGNYKIEAWGAQGGSTDKYAGGKGAYTAGLIHLEQDDQLYIYVGGTGGYGSGSSYAAGGYNGGGSSSRPDNNRTSCSGGGATDIRVFGDYTPTTSDLQWNSNIGLRSRIMVAAGGSGGADISYDYTGAYTDGVAGGTLKGINGTIGYRYDSSVWNGQGGTQTSGGIGGRSNSNIVGKFGQGGNVNNEDIGWVAGGGGGGYYGGGGAQGYGSSGGSGSSFISGYLGCVAVESSTNTTPRLDSNNEKCTDSSAANDITCSKHYSNKIFYGGKMISGEEEMPTYTRSVTMTGNSGNGYARVSYHPYSLSDNFLETLVFSKGTLNKEFYSGDTEYTLTIGAYTRFLNVSGTLHDDEYATVVGFDDYILDKEASPITITVTALDGSVRVYTINIQREPENAHSSKLYEINNVTNEEIIPVDGDVYTYELKVYSNQEVLDIIPVPYDSEATWTFSNSALIFNTGTITLTVRAPNTTSTTYYLNYTKERVGSVNEEYNFEIGYRKFTAPYSGSYFIELWGAEGTSASVAAGHGAYTSGYLKLKAGETIYIYTGGAGWQNTSAGYGYNGGKQGGWCGGGASDIRYFGDYTPTEDDLVWNSTIGLKSRIMVAAGGGGGSDYGTGTGGYGGALVGGVGAYDSRTAQSYAPTGGTQTSGGKKAIQYSGWYNNNGSAGSFGQGGVGDTYGGYNGGGGAGGYYGGGGGASGYSQAGGGGSSFISGYTGCVAIQDTDEIQPRLDSNGDVCTDASAKNDELCSLHYSNKKFVNGVMIPGNQEVPSWTDGSTTMADTLGNAGNGHARITLSNLSGNNYLASLTSSSGTLSPTFDPSVTDYTLTVDYYTHRITLEGTLGDPEAASVTGLGEYILKVTPEPIVVSVTAEDGSVRNYNLKLVRNMIPGHSSKLYTIYSVDNDELIECERGIYTYDVTVYSHQLYLDFEIEAYDEEATYVITDNYFPTAEGNITITVSAPEVSDTTYTLHYVKVTQSFEPTDFNYTGDEQVFIAPYKGYYKLETWGAQGGSPVQYSGSGNYIGGYGGYSVGVVLLEKNEKLYINVGGQGTYQQGCSTNSNAPGGYNGGGKSAWWDCSGNISNSQGSGGGATHIARISGLLSTLSDYKGEYIEDNQTYDSSDILIVSGGGGGALYYNNSNNYVSYGNGGHGGGYIGTGSYGMYRNGGGTYPYTVIGGSQNAGGSGNTSGSFGQGGQYLNTEVSAAGGGGGFFGGPSGHFGGGGGSGYIGSSNLLSLKGVTKSMYCYTCEESNLSEIKTVSNNKISENAISEFSKIGNGFARITPLGLASNNNFLSALNSDRGYFDKDFSSAINEYTLYVDLYDHDVTISGNLSDSNFATVDGFKKYDLTVKPKPIIITVTAEDGSVRTYTINIERKMEGGHSSKLFSIENSINEQVINCEKDVYVYNDLIVYSYQVELNIVPIPFDDSATYKIKGNELILNDGTITITVSAPGVQDTVYKLPFVRQERDLTPIDFEFSGEEESYVIPYTGNFLLEAWGAQGGNYDSSHIGGYGSYSVGVIKLYKDDVIYINVGGQPKLLSQGGYNGGGTASSNAGGGGGATSVATVSGQLQTLSDYKGTYSDSRKTYDSDKILIVAGGGGGSSWYTPNSCQRANGSHAGGIEGRISYNDICQGRNETSYGTGKTYGGTQNGNGKLVSFNQCGTNAGSFGKGANAVGCGYNSLGGGGAGWYGGNSGTIGGNYNITGGTGGSGYIGSSKLIEKHMTCYDCTESELEHVKTESNDCVNNEATADCSKSDNGHFRIKYYAVSQNNYLESVVADTGTWEKPFDPIVREQQINVSMYTQTITLSGTPSDVNAIVEGFGEYELEIGYNNIPITVTAQDGSTRVYTITVLRENLKGGHSAELMRINNVKNQELIRCTYQVYTYSILVYSYQTSIELDIKPYDSEATWVIRGNELILEPGVITIDVTAPSNLHTTYYLNFEILDAPLTENEFAYSGTIKEFVVKNTEKIKLEVWGAQGGNSRNNNSIEPGYGSYSVGYYSAKSGEKLYIVVGGQGVQAGSGGYNGGGNGSASDGGGGGGASHIATKTGLLSELEEYKDDVLIVAGGGGGNCNGGWTTDRHGGGQAGGYIGGTSVNSDESGAYRNSPGGNPETKTYQFGQGQNGRQPRGGTAGSEGAGGGGGGYYGGEALQYYGGYSNVAGGGGSGHIGNSKLISYAGIEKHMTCYNCNEYDESDKLTISTEEVDTNPTADKAKKGSGYIKITTGGLSDNNYLRSLTSSISTSDNDEEIWDKEFNTILFDYTINVNAYTFEIYLDAETYSESARVNGLGRHHLSLGSNDIPITVTAEDGSIRTYNVTVVRNKLDHPSSELMQYNIDGSINEVPKGETEFDVNILSGVYQLDVEGIPFDSDATVTYSGFGYIKTNKTCYIIVNNPKASPSQTIYKFNVTKGDVTGTYEFDYTGTVQTFDVEFTGFYQIEAWGAQGGNASGYAGGYGAYSTGIAKLNGGETLYIYTGGQGRSNVSQQITYSDYDGWTYCAGEGGTCNALAGALIAYGERSTFAFRKLGDTQTSIGCNNGVFGDPLGGVVKKCMYTTEPIKSKSGDDTGGYNGGGNANPSLTYAGAGGGATHISTTPGLLSELSNKKGDFNEETGTYDSEDIIIVAGGGGGAGYSGTAQGGSGGGYLGNYNSTNGTGYGGSQTSGGQGSNAGTFGLGGTRKSSGGGAGGGGFFGGGAAFGDYGAGGGSGFIASRRLQSIKTLPKHMTCYNCSTSEEDETYTETTTRVSSSPTTDYAKSGNGFVRITVLNLSTNNFLSNIDVHNIIEEDNPIKLNLKEEFDMNNSDYTIKVDKNVTRIRLSGKPEDSKADIVGFGDFDVPVGETTYTILVTAENADEREYRVKVTREADENNKPADITITGLIKSLCSTNEDYCKLLNKSNGNETSFNEDIHNYELTVPSRIKQLKWNVQKGNTNQLVKGDGVTQLGSGNTKITIEIESEYCAYYYPELNEEVPEDPEEEYTPADRTDPKYANCFSTYTYDVTRIVSDDTDLSDLRIDTAAIPEGDEGHNFDFDLNYTDPDVFDYFFAVPNTWDKVNYLIATPDAYDDGARVEIIGNENFVVGESNLVTLRVTAPDKVTMRDYRLHVYRKLSQNIFITNVSVGDLSISPEFNKYNFGDYTITIPNDKNSVRLSFDVDYTTTTASFVKTRAVSINESRSGDTYTVDINNIPTDKTYYELNTVAENSEYTGTYTFVINRIKNADSSLSSLTAEANGDTLTLEPELTNSVYNYVVNVDAGVSSVDISATPTVDTSTYYLADDNVIRVGDNNKRIVVTAEDGSYSIYVITFKRPAFSDATLSNIVVTGNDSNTYAVKDNENNDFDPSVNSYNVVVPNNVTSITLEGIKNNYLANVYGNGKYYLQTGLNDLSLTVSAEDGTTNYYYLTVQREPNADASVSYINAYYNSDNHAFECVETTCSITVPYNIYKTDINYGFNARTTSGTFTNNSNDAISTRNVELSTGVNTFKLSTKAEDNTQLTYTLNITKEISTVNTFDSIALREAKIKYVDYNDYSAKVPYDIRTVNFKVVESDPAASHVITSNDTDLVITDDKVENLKQGDNELLVTIYAEDGTTNIVSVTVTVLDEGAANNYLMSLTTDKGTLSPTFDKTISHYEVEVPYTDTKIKVSARVEVEDEVSTITGLGSYNLNVGENELYVVVESIDGIERTYSITVTRNNSTDSSLKDLTINKTILNPSFDSEVLEYDITIDDNEIPFTTIVPTMSSSTYEIFGNENLINVGTTYNVSIVVTAPNGINQTTYVIHAKRVTSTNAYLKSLSVEDYSISPGFDPFKTTYTLSVPNSVTSVLVNAEAQNSNASIQGKGAKTLVPGDNFVNIIVTAEDNVTVKKYTICITRGVSSNTNLEYLAILNGELKNEYSHSLDLYYVDVFADQDHLDFQIIFEDPGTTYSIRNNYFERDSVVYVDVTAADGTTRLLTFNVTVKPLISSLLKNLEIDNYWFDNDFDSNVFRYNLTINYEDTYIDLDYVTVDPGAIVSVAGNTYASLDTNNKKIRFSNLEVGSKELTIDVTDSIGESTSTYRINLTRNPYVDNFLEYFYNDYNDGEWIENFNKLKYIYTLNVDKNTDNITLFGAASTSKAQISVTTKNSTYTTENLTDKIGSYKLNKGKNEFVVNVTLNGYTRKYKAIVTRAFNTENDLLDLVVRNGRDYFDLTPEFSSSHTSYSLSVDEDVNSVTLQANASEGAIVSGLGKKNLNPGINSFVITVTAEDGTPNVYTLNITKSANNNAKLVDMIPSEGELSPPFGYETNSYDLVLDGSVSTLYFTVMTENANATVEGEEEMLVPDGDSIRIITVTAEDRTTEEVYTINVSKVVSNDADLLNLKVRDYEFIDKVEELKNVTFDKDTQEYYVIVDNDMKKINSSDINATTSDDGATLLYSSETVIPTDEYVEFVVSVLAEDKVTKKDYTINIKRKIGTSSKIKSVNPTTGYLETSFSEYNDDYVWVTPKGRVDSIDELGYELVDENASVNIDLINETYVITVTSEDGSSTTTYSFMLKKSNNVYLESLEIKDNTNVVYPLIPDLDSDITDYTVHAYTNARNVTITAKANESDIIVKMFDDLVDSKVSESPETYTLTNDEENYTIQFFDDGDLPISEYHIKLIKDALTDKTLNSLYINDSESVCEGSMCKIKPNFKPLITSYKVEVPYAYDTLDIGYTKSNEQQTVKFKKDGKEIQNGDPIEVGSNVIQVEVYDLVNVLTKTYNLTITRTKAGNADLKSLTIDGYSLTPEFDKDTLEYDIEVPVDVTEIDVTAIADDEEASVTVNGYNHLASGDNEVTITVLAADKKTYKTYIVHVFVGDPAKKSFLKSISVSSGSKFYDLSPKFKKSTTAYMVTTDSSTESVMIEATYDTTRNISVIGEGEYNIFTGVNVFTLTSTLYEDDNTTVISSTVYTISVVRPISSNVYLTDLKVTSSEETELLNDQGYYNLSKPFDKGTTEYGLTVSPGISTLDIRYKLDDQTSRVVIYGNRLVTGTNYVDVVVFNQDETLTKTYQITVEVLPSADSSLTAIKVYDTYVDEFENDQENVYGISQEDFEASVDNTYTVNVPYDVEKVILEGTARISKSIVIGNGTYYLDYGNNELSISVEAEDGEHFSVYTINVYRAYDLYLSNLKVDNTSITDFDKTNENYTMEVENSVKSLIIEGIPEENNVEVIYSLDSDTAAGGEIIDGKLFTGVGTNKVLITVRAPDNTEKVYHLDITRKQSDNNYLEALDFNEGNLNEVFIKTDNNYTMYILDTYTSISYDNKKDILTEDPTASYVVEGINNLSTEHDNTVTITVTSESGLTNIYTVTVMLKPEEWFKHYLQKLELSYKTKGTNNEDITSNVSLSPVFVKETKAYTATVPYSVSSITVNTQTYIEDDEALIKSSTEPAGIIADGTFSLDLGRNVINIKVYSTLPNNDGSFSIYKVIVYRQNNPDAYLASLAITDHPLKPGFASATLNYEIDIDTSTTKLDIEAIPRDPGAEIEIIGNGNFNEGENVITIRVTAADGSTKRDYKITAHSTLSDNNYLRSLSVKDYDIDPGFTKTNTGIYLINVNETVSNVYVTAIREVSDSSLKIVTNTSEYVNKESISMNLEPGNNFVYLTVISAAGNSRTYTLNVFRAYSSDNKLKNLVISDGDLEPEFDPDVTTYTVTLEDDLEKLDNVSVIGFKNHTAATIKGNGSHALKGTGTTSVVITVTSQSGDKKEYTVNFVKKEAPSCKLLVLDVYEGELIPDFTSDGTTYYVTVPNEITSLDLEVEKNVIPEDENATVEITGNSDFKVGINPVVIKVTSTKGVEKSYQVYVTRSILASNYLKELYVEGYDLTPEFNKETIYYELDVSSEIDKVNLYALLEDNNSTIEIDGELDATSKEMTLDYGDNKVYVSVTSQTGAKRTYTVNVIRAQNSEYYLLTLITDKGTWNKAFDTETKEYVIDVENEDSVIKFTGTYSKGAYASGLGDVAVNVGETSHTIVITSASGLTNTYNFTINRPAKSNANVESITSNRGDLTLEDNVYKISVADSASSIKFTVNTEDPNATVNMDEYYRLDYGDNEIEIEVVAEDKVTSKKYTINVHRKKDLASINITKDVITLDIGEEETIYYDFDPADTDDRLVTWSVLDDTIATIDNGVVKALKNGITYVYLRSQTNPLIYDRVEINVSLKKITSSEYQVWHTDDEPNNLAAVEFSYIIGINDKTTIDNVINNLDNDIKTIKVYSNGSEITNYSSYAGTGMIIKLIINDIEYDSVVIIVRGDNGTIERPGNGIITSTDYATLSSILAGLTVKTPIVSLLYDLNKNKILTVTDLSPMSLYIAGKATFTNLNGLE